MNAYGHNVGENLKKELREQGHYLTGALEESIDAKLSKSGADVSLEIVAAEYINDLNTGIPAEHIDLSDPQYLQGLAEYARLRWNLKTERQQLQAAYNIASAHRREGMPTKNSYAFSATGERTEAIETSFNEHERENDQIFENTFSSELDEIINKTFDQTEF